MFSAALQTRLTAGTVSLQLDLWRFALHTGWTYGDLLFIQVYSDATPMHCSTGQGKIAFPMFSAALQTRLTAGTVSLQLHLWRFALVTAIIPVVICCSHRCAATQEMHCRTGQGKIRSPLFSAALQNRLTAGLCHCN